jgi:hypothetical protein
MNPYAALGSDLATAEAAALRARLRAWHDAMVAHERRLRAGRGNDRCDEECPHVEARALWTEAVAAFGTQANELAFLRSRAIVASRHAEAIAPTASGSEAADTVEAASRTVLSAPSAHRNNRERRQRELSP